MRRLLLVVLLVAPLVACSDDSRGSGQRSSGSARAQSELPSTSAATTTPTTLAGPPPPLALEKVATLRGPTAAAVRPGEDDLYVTEQAGRVRRLSSSEVVLDIASEVTSGGEQGLLGIAFSPKGDTVFLTYTNKESNQELDRFSVDGSGAIDPTSGERLLVIPDFAANHNGGDIVFGPDGYLYWAMGDGGGAGDPHQSGQDPSDLLGNILRIDPLTPGSDGTPYAIPPDNPFANGGGAPEVYAFGLRNPWRFSFDRATNDLWIADVGQGNWEEIDFAPAASGRGRGANFGWSVLEGTHSFRGDTAPAGAVPPVYEYDHSRGDCAVTGGYVYRGKSIPQLAGNYLFGDYCGGELQALRMENGQAVVVDLNLNINGLSTFAEDANGELYAMSLRGDVYRIVAA